jgi:hypothetical protein
MTYSHYVQPPYARRGRQRRALDLGLLLSPLLSAQFLEEGFVALFNFLNLPQHFILLGFSELFKRMCQQRLKIRESHPTLDYETTL